MRRATRGHVLLEALVGGAVLVLVLTGLASSEIAARRLLERGIDEVELARAASERLEWLRAEPLTSATWTAPSGGAVAGRPGWTWSIEPEALVDTAMAGVASPPGLRRARVTVTAADGRSLSMEALKW